MEQLDTLIGVLSEPPEWLLEAVDKTPVTLSVDQNQIPSVDSQTPVPSELPATEHEQIFSLRQKPVYLLINKYTKHKLTIIRCQSQRLIWHRSESYNVLLSYNENREGSF